MSVYKYYFNVVRPYIKKQFPPGKDGQSVINGIALKPENEDHNRVFYDLLQKFKDFGSLTNVTSDFKRKLYESFLKESQIVKEFGQFFTPRNVVSCMYDIANVDSLTPGKTIMDPACGVGGFILEAFARDADAQWTRTRPQLIARHKWSGYDREMQTAVLAKANALVHCGRLITNQPRRVASFAKWLNTVFKWEEKSILGSLSLLLENHADIILTNPPYVVSGSQDYMKIVKKQAKFRRYFECPATGVEGLFVQFIVKSLKENGHAVILLPETLLLRGTDKRLRAWLLQHCHLDMIALLPENTFYNTAKRVAILSFKKRRRGARASLESERVLLSIVSEVGETRDAKRFPCRSDLSELVIQYRRFEADPENYEGPLRFKSISAKQLADREVWYLPGWWTEQQRMELGLLEPEKDPAERVRSAQGLLVGLKQKVENGLNVVSGLSPPPEPAEVMELRLSNKAYFKMRIGRRMLKKDFYLLESGIPLFSANVRKPFGFVQKANAGNLSNGGCLWSIDSDFDVRSVSPGERYAVTDHCGELELVQGNIYAPYLAHKLKRAGLVQGLGRDYRASLKNMAALRVKVPARRTGGGWNRTLNCNASGPTS